MPLAAVLRRQAVEQLLQGRRILGPDRPQPNLAAVAQGGRLLQLARVRPHGQPRAAVGSRPHQLDMRVEHDHALAIDQERVDCQPPDRWLLDDEVGQPHQDLDHTVQERVAFRLLRQKAPDRRLVEHGVGQGRVQWRQEVGDGGAGRPQRGVTEQQHRPEGRVGLHAEIELDRKQGALHALYQQALDRSARSDGGHLLQHVPATAQQRSLVDDVQRHTADRALLRQLRADNLERHRIAELARGGRGGVEIGHDPRRHARDGVGVEQRHGVGLVQRAAPRRQGRVDQARRALPVEGAVGARRRDLAQDELALLVLDAISEGAHRGLGRPEDRDRRLVERCRGRILGDLAQPGREHRALRAARLASICRRLPPRLPPRPDRCRPPERGSPARRRDLASAAAPPKPPHRRRRPHPARDPPSSPARRPRPRQR